MPSPSSSSSSSTIVTTEFYIRSPLMRCRQQRRPVAVVVACIYFFCMLDIYRSFQVQAAPLPYPIYTFSHQSRVDFIQYFDFLPHFHSFHLWYHIFYFTVIKIKYRMQWTRWRLLLSADDCRRT